MESPAVGRDLGASTAEPRGRPAIDPVLGKKAQNLQSNPRVLLAGGCFSVHYPRAEVLGLGGFFAGLDDLDRCHDDVS